MKDYNSITFKNRAIDRLTVETTKPGKTIDRTTPVKYLGKSEQERRDEDYKKVSESQRKKRETEKKYQEELLARRKRL